MRCENQMRADEQASGIALSPNPSQIHVCAINALPVSATIDDGRVAEWFKAPVLKTGRGFCSLVGSNPTPSASSPSVIVRLRSLFFTQAIAPQVIFAHNDFAVVRGRPLQSG
jgi:hypothetical protein